MAGERTMVPLDGRIWRVSCTAPWGANPHPGDRLQAGYDAACALGDDGEGRFALSIRETDISCARTFSGHAHVPGKGQEGPDTLFSVEGSRHCGILPGTAGSSSGSGSGSDQGACRPRGGIGFAEG